MRKLSRRMSADESGLPGHLKRQLGRFIMEPVTELATIEYTAISKEDENWRFMVFLKGYDISGKDLNGLVRELCSSISAQVDCTSCANCCRNLKPVLEPADIQRLSVKFGISEDLFFQEYLKTDPEGEVIFKSMPCDFLKNRKCSCYDARPEVCRSYPHLLNSDFRSRLIKIVQNCCICPIVYNVYEELKKKFEEPFRAFEADLHFLDQPPSSFEELIHVIEQVKEQCSCPDQICSSVPENP